MKAIMISIKPKWCSLIMNGTKKIEVRKGTALYKATKKLIDEYGVAEFYVYCTKDSKGYLTEYRSKEENKLLRESNENLDENYYDTWYACERLKENNNYALMFIDGTYCLVDTKDNKFDVIDEYKINNNGIVDNGSQKKLKVLDILKPFLYINDENTLRLSNIMGITFLDREVIDLLKEVLK